jgi:hypothetical protein
MGSKEKKYEAPAGMDLKDFVAQTLSAIALAVPAANQAVLEADPKREGDVVFKLAPSLKRSAKTPPDIGDAVQFDIAVQVTPAAAPGGAPKLTVPAMDAGSKSKHAKGDNLSWVHFEVNVHHAVGDGRKGGG